MKDNFLWGGALSNVQAEGSILKMGKGLNVYDCQIVEPKLNIPLESCPSDIATGHFNHYKEDIDYMVEMGFKAYRFSIIWSRIHPLGIESEPNEEGLLFYEDMINYLLEKHIEPVCSLVHFDMPVYLAENYNGFINKKVIELYEKHVASVVSRFKNKVKYWITYNEVNLAPFMPYLVAGSNLQNNQNKNEFFVQMVINTQLAHAKAVKVIKEIDSKAKVGGMIAYSFYQPCTNRSEDLLILNFVNKMRNYLSLDIMTKGNLPRYFIDFIERRQLKYDFKQDERDLILDSSKKLDFIAFSYYSSTMVGNVISIDISDFQKQEDAVLWGHGSSRNPLYPASEWNWTTHVVY